MSLMTRIRDALDDGGFFHIGNRITVYYGNSAMHWTVNIWTKRWGYICKRFRSKGVKPYFYCSPNGTPWASTYYRGWDKDERVRSVIRKELFGHNFDPDGYVTDEYPYIPIRDILFSINDYTGAKPYYYRYIKEAIEEKVHNERVSNPRQF